MSADTTCICGNCAVKRDVDALISSVLYLMSRYARERDIQLIGLVEEHLVWLSEHPDTAKYPALQRTSRRLSISWRSMAFENPRDLTTVKHQLH